MQFVQRLDHAHRGDVPFLGGCVIAVQVDPQSGRNLAPGAEVLEDCAPGVMDAALANQREPALDRCQVAAAVRHFRVRVGHSLQQGNHLQQQILFLQGRRQGLESVPPGQFAGDETHRRTRLLEHLEVRQRRRRRCEHAADHAHQYVARKVEIGQRNRLKQVQALLWVGVVELQLRKIHGNPGATRVRFIQLVVLAQGLE